MADASKIATREAIAPRDLFWKLFGIAFEDAYLTVPSASRLCKVEGRCLNLRLVGPVALFYVQSSRTWQNRGDV